MYFVLLNLLWHSFMFFSHENRFFVWVLQRIMHWLEVFQVRLGCWQNYFFWLHVSLNILCDLTCCHPVLILFWFLSQLFYFNINIFQIIMPWVEVFQARLGCWPNYSFLVRVSNVTLFDFACNWPVLNFFLLTVVFHYVHAYCRWK